MSKNALEICLKCRETLALSAKRLKCDKLLCGSVCHLYCTGLTEEQLQVLKIIPNIQWHCELCLEREQNSLEQCVRQHEKRLQMLEEGLGAKLNDPTQPPLLCPYMPSTISRKAITLTVIFVLLTSILGVILATTTNIFGKTLNKSKLGDGDDSRQNIPINSTIDQDNIGGGLVLRFVPRAAWLAQPPQKTLPELRHPIPLVIVLPTNSENCSTQAECVFRVRFRQTYDIESLQQDDIAFNFLIGGDGNVYMGRGWDQVGAHMQGYNSRSLSLAYIGSFQKQKPSAKQLSVTRLLLEMGVNEGKIAPNYKLTAASKLEPTLTDYKADLLYQSFGNWTHWS